MRLNATGSKSGRQLNVFERRGHKVAVVDGAEHSAGPRQMIAQAEPRTDQVVGHHQAVAVVAHPGMDGEVGKGREAVLYVDASLAAPPSAAEVEGFDLHSGEDTGRKARASGKSRVPRQAESNLRVDNFIAVILTVVITKLPRIKHKNLRWD